MAQEIDTVEGRLQRLEEAFEGADHGATTRMAARLGVSVTRWVNAKSGRGLSKELAIILVQKVPGLRMDWLFLGTKDGLSWAMAEFSTIERNSYGPDPRAC